jgi:amino acid transporter
VRVNTLSGITATIFMVVAIAAFSGGNDAKFKIVLTIAISTTLISYLWIFPAALKLRFTHGGVHRPYRVPGGRAGVIVASGLATAWVALGSWVAVFPGTLENLFGVAYNFKDTWGVSRATYETLTLCTLAVVLLIAVVGYAVSSDVRADVVQLPIEPEPLEPAAAA